MSDNINSTLPSEINPDDIPGIKFMSTKPEWPLRLGIISWNINGINNKQFKKKVNTLRHILNNTKINIILLQETHFTSSSETIWRAKFPKYQCFFNNGTSKTNGVAIGVTFDRGFVTKKSNTNFLQRYVKYFALAALLIY